MAFVTIFQTADPIVAEMLVGVLQNEGLNARLLGTRNGAAIGVGQHILRLRIEVPSEEVAQGTEIVDAFEKGEVVAATDEEAGVEDQAADDKAETFERQEQRKSPILAAGISFLIPGGSHFYARRFWTGALVAVGIILGIVNSAQPDPVRGTAAFITILGLVAFDLVLGQLAVRATNRGARWGAVKQLLIGASALFVAGGAGAVIAPRLPHVKKQQVMEIQLVQPVPAPEGTFLHLFP